MILVAFLTHVREKYRRQAVQKNTRCGGTPPAGRYLVNMLLVLVGQIYFSAAEPRQLSALANQPRAILS